MNIEQFLQSVGRPRFRDAIGVSDQLITRAVDEGLMPASWYFEVRDWCVANKIDVPDHLFKRRRRKLGNAGTTQNEKSSANCQEVRPKSVPAEPISDADFDEHVQFGDAS